MLTFKTSHLIISAEERISWTLDGEFGGEHDRVVINNIQEAISIVTPR